MAEPSLYERLGGIFAIAAVIDNFSDRLLTGTFEQSRIARPPRAETLG